jgi:cephalosporin hydroxylase/glycosyltransferase involved in cell wall biosynthesis
LGADCRLDVIDPEPNFDPAEHERRFRGRYVFHRDTSHNVLPHLEPPDVALIDGDHNWYTVHRELDMLRTVARETGAMLPVLVMHDVLWPYGRRDLYYEPERIPDEFRQPHKRAGMLPGHEALLDGGGLNPMLDNALREGGPRNGVMTALDDFTAEHDRPLRRIVLPIYFGLAIVAEEERLAAQPELAAVFDQLESPECRHELLELSESLRLQLMVEVRDLMVRFDVESFNRAARRYIEMLKGALLNEHNLENEVRLEYLISCHENGVVPELAHLRDPAHHLGGGLQQLRQARRAGSLQSAWRGTASFPYAGMGRNRLDHLERCLGAIRADSIEGDLVECGVGRGGGAIFMRGYLSAFEVPDRQVWAADGFMSPAGLGPDANGVANQIADLNMVRAGFARFGLLDERVRFLQGAPPETLAEAPIDQVALLRIDCELTGSPAGVLDALYDKLSVGAFVVVDGYSSPDCQEAIEAFRARRGIDEVMERVDDGSVFWRKQQAAPDSVSDSTTEPGHGYPPLAPPLPEAPCELSVVVVLHDMRREGERTLHSLSRAYQEGIEDLDYEVVVVENGSAMQQKLGARKVRGFGPQFRYLDLGDQATPSPAHAINRGIDVARGEVIALMVDGAHLLSPGVLRFGMLGVRSHEPAIVATQQWYVGPGQQNTTVLEGYDSEFEDALFERIDWPRDGYRLFEIGHFISDRDWFDGIWESNCVFMPRRLLEQAGCMDEGFSMPGGGFTNLDIYERVGATPGVNVVTILGEASFHQVHGGTTTNESATGNGGGLVPAYREHYAQRRNRPHRWTGKPLHYVGSMTDAARRTRPRRRGAPGLRNTRFELESDGRPTRPVPLPEELQTEFTDAYWRSFRWQRTKWLGHPVARSPADLLAYQELIFEAKPDWVIETPGDAGRALFLASICELAEQGQVLSIAEGAPDELPKHPRLTHIAGDPLDSKIVARVRKAVGEPPNGLVVFGLAGRSWLLKAFELYAPLVPLGSGVVFEDTIMTRPGVWPGMGPGPAEAAREIVRRDTRFSRDPRMTQLAPTFNAGGYLRRLT